MKERPILFNATSVQAILAGNKTQTRRVIKPQPTLGQPWKHGWVIDPEVMDIPIAYCPYGIIGDRLWVREAFSLDLWIAASTIIYRADYADGKHFDGFLEREVSWRPSIFMPRWASRITLEIIDVRVEQLQDIQCHDLAAELGTFGGLADDFAEDHIHFIQVWNSINTKRDFGWDVNPWVWVIGFSKCG